MIRLIDEKETSVNVTPDPPNGPRTTLTSIFCNRRGWDVWTTQPAAFPDTVVIKNLTREDACRLLGITDDDREVNLALDRLLTRARRRLEAL